MADQDFRSLGIASRASRAIKAIRTILAIRATPAIRAIKASHPRAGACIHRRHGADLACPPR